MINLDSICDYNYVLNDEYSCLEISFQQFCLWQNSEKYRLSFSEIRTNQIFQTDFISRAEWQKEYFIEKDNIEDITININFLNNAITVKIIGNEKFKLQLSGYLDNQFQAYDLWVKSIELNLKNYFDALNLANILINTSKKYQFNNEN
jgi:hypothetical protein